MLTEQNGLYLFSKEVFHSIVTNNFNVLFSFCVNICVNIKYVCQRSVREINVCFFVGRFALFVGPYISHAY